tara:strand:+ start:3178 stop:3996 length:819 start_codon:yes stop_codon:yes gene_type:complete
MMIDRIIQSIVVKKSFLCVGLDPDLNLIPQHLLDSVDPVFEFNKSIIDVTRDLCVAYKPNLAFYEKLGPSGLISLKKTIDYIGDEHFVIADAKRSDIFNSAKMYADTFYDYFNVDAVTISPYMGFDAVKPFLRKDKYGILLLVTSNPTGSDIQNIITKSGHPLYIDLVKHFLEKCSEKNTMFVLGATRLNEMRQVREIASNHFFLIPGVGAQGGSLKKVCENGFGSDCRLLINSSRAIIYAGSGINFKDDVRIASMNLQKEMMMILKDFHFI